MKVNVSINVKKSALVELPDVSKPVAHIAVFSMVRHLLYHYHDVITDIAVLDDDGKVIKRFSYDETTEEISWKDVHDGH